MSGRLDPQYEDNSIDPEDEPIDDLDAADGHGEQEALTTIICLDCGERSEVDVNGDDDDVCPLCGSADIEIADVEELG